MKITQCNSLRHLPKTYSCRNITDHMLTVSKWGLMKLLNVFCSHTPVHTSDLDKEDVFITHTHTHTHSPAPLITRAVWFSMTFSTNTDWLFVTHQSLEDRSSLKHTRHTLCSFTDLSHQTQAFVLVPFLGCVVKITVLINK